MSKISDKKFILILLILGLIYFYIKGSSSNKNIDLSKVEFVVDGQQKTIPNYLGKKLVINFYASWCRPCMHEIPSMARTANEWQDVTFLWLSDENQELINKSRNKFNQKTFYQLTQPFSAIGIKSIPYTVIINEAGKTVYASSGELGWNDSSFKSKIREKLDL